MQKFYASGSPRAAVAEYEGTQSGRLRLSVVKVSASGTGTVTGRPRWCPGFEAIYEDGTALTVDLSEDQVSYVLPADFREVKVTSDNAADEFYLILAPVDDRN